MEINKYHLVNWKTVKAPKQHGGLGIMDPGIANMAIRVKLYWSYVTNPSQWWSQVMRLSIYLYQMIELDNWPLDGVPPLGV